MKKKIVVLFAMLPLVFAAQFNPVYAFESKTIETKKLPLNVDGTNGKEQYSIIISQEDVGRKPKVTILSFDKDMENVNASIYVDGKAVANGMELNIGASIWTSNDITQEQVGKKISVVMSTNSKTQNICKIELSKT